MNTKRALIFGNNNYNKSEKLQCCVNDARDIALKLTFMGFEVVIGCDLTCIEMQRKIVQFQEEIEQNDLVVFFFSGHGVEWKGQTYLISIDDQHVMEYPEMCEHQAVSVQKTLESIISLRPYAAIFLLDCCRINLGDPKSRGKLKAVTSNESFSDIALIKGAAGSLIAFACAPNEVTFDKSRNGRNSLFTYHLLKHITELNLKVEDMMCRVCDGMYIDTGEDMLSYRISRLRTSEIYFHTTKTSRATDRLAVVPQMPSYPARWRTNGATVAGSNDEQDENDQLNCPCGIFVDDDRTVYIAEFKNHRITAWKVGVPRGEVVAGGNGQGNRLDQLNVPTDVTMDRETDSLFICDLGNRRVMRWSLRSFSSSRRQGEIIIDNIACRGLTMDEQGSLYVSDIEKHEVRRYDKGGDKKGTVVAGGYGEGDKLNQLGLPTFLFVDAQSTLYVSDSPNHRVMKWMQGAKEGIVVAGGNGEGKDLTQLSYPRGVWVDKFGHVHVVDSWNDRVMCWEKGAKQGIIVVGGNGRGRKANQLSCPQSLFFDHFGHLYVSDYATNRVQRFSLIVDQ